MRRAGNGTGEEWNGLRQEGWGRRVEQMELIAKHENEKITMGNRYGDDDKNRGWVVVP